MKLFLVRHGETDLNKERKFQGRSDYELNKNGIKQAKALRSFFKKREIDVIVSSPLKRTLQTAEIINKVLKKNIIIEELAIERDFGLLEGKRYNEINFNPDEDKLFYERYKVEPKDIFLNRVNKLLNKLKKEYKGKNVLLVTHGGLIKAVLAIVLDLDYKISQTRIKKNNCSITEIDFSNENPVVLRINYTVDIKKLF